MSDRTIYAQRFKYTWGDAAEIRQQESGSWVAKVGAVTRTGATRIEATRAAIGAYLHELVDRAVAKLNDGDAED